MPTTHCTLICFLAKKTVYEARTGIYEDMGLAMPNPDEPQVTPLVGFANVLNFCYVGVVSPNEVHVVHHGFVAVEVLPIHFGDGLGSC